MEWIDKLKNTRFIRTVCNRISEMNPVLVGILTGLSYLILIILGACALLTVIVAIFAAIMLSSIVAGMIPFGIGVGMFGVGIQVGIWIGFNDGRDTSYIVKQSLKMWGLAVLLGSSAFMFSHLGRYFLFESLTLGLDANNGSLVGFRILTIGWAIIGASKLPKLFYLIPLSYNLVKDELASTGLKSIEKCAELNETIE